MKRGNTYIVTKQIKIWQLYTYSTQLSRLGIIYKKGTKW